MANIGVVVTSQEVPPAVLNAFNTANAFAVGYADWGPIGSTGVTAPVISLSQVAQQIGAPNGGLIQAARTATNATLYDSADAYFREGGGTLYVSRVVGNSPTHGSLVLLDAGNNPSMTITAAYVGAASSTINVIVNNTGTSYTLKLTDSAGNPLTSTSPAFTATDKTDAIAWAAATNYVTIVSDDANLPVSITAALSAGSDDRGTVTLANWSAALNGFAPELGPGQVFAPGQSNTALPGIWQALASHALSNNRVALLDGADGNAASAAIAEVTTANIPVSLQSYAGLWTGNLQIPGIVLGTTRIIPPSPVVAALCARVDALGNPNLAPAGVNYPLSYVSGVNTTYTGALGGDISNMNNFGINVFASVYQTLQNYGFVSLVATPSNDAIYWQLDHARLRMAVTSQARVVAQPFVFSQVDGQGHLLSQFDGALQSMLQNFYGAGALYGATASDAFSVNTTSAVNTPQTLAAGQLWAQLAVRMSPFGQLVEIVINAVPITQQLTQVAAGTI